MHADANSSLRLMLTMSMAGLVSGLILVGVHLWTAPRIAQNRKAALERAIYHVLPGAESYQAFAVGDVDSDAAAFLGLDAKGQSVGFALAGEGAGYMDTIRLLFGYDPERALVVGMQVLESKETPGLGDKIIFDPDFLRNFEALAVDPDILLVKKGAKTQAHEVNGITGATISSRAVVKILNQSLEQWRPRLAAPVERSSGPFKTARSTVLREEAKGEQP